MSSPVHTLNRIQPAWNLDEKGLVEFLKPMTDCLEEAVEESVYNELHRHMIIYTDVTLYELSHLYVWKGPSDLMWQHKMVLKSRSYRILESAYLDCMGLFAIDNLVRKIQTLMQEASKDQIKCCFDIHLRFAGHKTPSMLSPKFVIEADYLGRKVFTKLLENGINPFKSDVKAQAEIKLCCRL